MTQANLQKYSFSKTKDGNYPDLLATHLCFLTTTWTSLSFLCHPFIHLKITSKCYTLNAIIHRYTSSYH